MDFFIYLQQGRDFASFQTLLNVQVKVNFMTWSSYGTKTDSNHLTVKTWKKTKNKKKYIYKIFTAMSSFWEIEIRRVSSIMRNHRLRDWITSFLWVYKDKSSVRSDIIGLFVQTITFPKWNTEWMNGGSEKSAARKLWNWYETLAGPELIFCNPWANTLPDRQPSSSCSVPRESKLKGSYNFHFDVLLMTERRNVLSWVEKTLYRHKAFQTEEKGYGWSMRATVKMNETFIKHNLHICYYPSVTDASPYFLLDYLATSVFN